MNKKFNMKPKKAQLKRLMTLGLFIMIGCLVLVMATWYSVGDVTNSFQLEYPLNDSTVPNHYTNLNVSVNETGNLKVLIFANENKSRLDLRDSLVYINLNATENIFYNFTTIPIQHDDEGLVALYHFDNLSEYGENSTHVYDFANSGGVNNGTVVGAIWNESGKIGGAYTGFLNTTANQKVIKRTEVVQPTDNFTVSVWIYPKGYGVTTTQYSHIINFIPEYSGWISWGKESAGSTFCYMAGHTAEGDFDTSWNNNLLEFTSTSYNGLTNCPIGKWANIIVTGEYNGSSTEITFYINGNEAMNAKTIGPMISTGNTMQIGSHDGYPQFNYKSFNGTIDEVAIYNKTLNESEVLNIYRLGANKKYYWKVNATDTSGNSNESEILEFTTTNPIITINFSDSIGNIRSNFYGVNTHGKWGTDTSLIDVDADGTRDTDSNYTWHRKAFLNSGMTIMRADMYLSSLANEDGTFKTTSGNNDNRAMRYDLVKWAYENNIKILFIASSMPSWLRNTTEGWCTTSPWTCPPKNYTRWGELVVDFIDNVTVNGLYNSTIMIEVKNEPDLISFWMSDVAVTNINRSIEYNKFYNATWNEVKEKYPNMAVGGPAVARVETVGGKLIYQNWLGNFTTNMDFFSFHRYRTMSLENYDDVLKSDYNDIITNCNTYGANCSRILLDEFNEWDSNNKLNNQDFWGMQLALSFSGTINNYPENVSMVSYQWAEFLNYTEGSANYPEYPQKWAMVSEPQLENEYYRSYNVTKSFATYHRTGSTVYTSTSDNNDVKVVLSKYGLMDAITIINTDSEQVNVTLNLVGKVLNTLYDVDGNIYTITDNSTEIGLLDGYEIKYLFTRIYDRKANLDYYTYSPNVNHDNFNWSSGSYDTTYLKLQNSEGTNKVDIYNLTNALVYYSNGSIAGDNNLQNNDGNINITLTPNNYSYVFDQANITENADRTNFPITFEYQTDTEKLLKNTINMVNLTTVLNVSNCSISNIEYYSTTGTYRKNLSSSDWSCSGNTLIFNDPIEYEPDTYAVNFSVTLPTSITSFRVASNSSTQYNMTPIGQNDTVPIFNITSYSLFDSSIWLSANLSNSCVSLFAANNSDRDTKKNINSTYSDMLDLGANSEEGIWMWVDYNSCSVSGNSFGFKIEGRYP